MAIARKEIDFEDKNLFNLCHEQIQKKVSFEVRVPARDADAVKKAVNAFASVDEASAERFPKRLIRLWGLYIKSFRFPILMGVINSAQLARFEIFLREQQDGLCIVFERAR